MVISKYLDSCGYTLNILVRPYCLLYGSGTLPWCCPALRAMAFHDFATDVRAHVTDAVGLEARGAIGNGGLFWHLFSASGELALSSAVLCRVMYRAALWKPVCDTRRTAGKTHVGMLGGDVMDDDKMWQLMLYLAWRWRRRWASVET